MMVQGADATNNTGALAKSLVALAAPGRCYSVTVWNDSVNTLYIQLHDAAALPSNGAVTKIVDVCPGGSSKAYDFQDGRIFRTGIVVAASSTSATLTLTATNDVIIDCTYRAK